MYFEYFCYNNCMIKKIIATNKKHLISLIYEEIKLSGTECDLNHIDISGVTNLSALFFESKFNGDISNWDVSNVTDMSYLFYNSKFNGSISAWDTSNITDMSNLFNKSKFNGDISTWDVFNVTK